MPKLRNITSTRLRPKNEAQNYTKCVMPANAGIQVRSVLAKGNMLDTLNSQTKATHFCISGCIDVMKAAPLDGPEFRV